MGIDIVFTTSIIFLSLLLFLCLYRAYIGPRSTDRLVAVNTIATKVITIMCVMAFITDQYVFLDVAIIYAMMNFITTLCVCKFIEKGKLY